MLEQSQKLTDGLIIYSVLVSDYEKLDFKNDALAGVRANYFNSGCKEQKEITEIELHGMDYKMSCLLTKDEPLSWKVTRDNLPYQSVKRATGGVYSVITYNDRGIVFKRQFFDRNHTWLRTEYFNRSIADKLITRIYPRKVSGIITLVTEDIDDNGIVSVKTLFPSDKQSNENSRVLIYSNVGMLWYDASFLPSDMPFTEKKSYGNSGFVFNGDLFKNDFVPENAYNLEDCAYLTDEDIPNVSDTAEPVSKKDYSAYDIIEKILVEAHKTNKDLFGEIINHTAEEDFEPAEVKIENEILMFLRKSSQLKNEVSIDEPLNTDWDGNELLLCDVLGSDPDTVNRNIECELEKSLVLQAVSKLRDRECLIMELRFGLNGRKEHTQKQVADKLGISQSYISRLEKKIIRQLKIDLDKAV